MTAGGTILLAGLGGAAGVFAADVAADAFYIRGNRMTVGAIGAGIGAALVTFVGVTVSAADAKKAGTLSGPPPQLLGWP